MDTNLIYKIIFVAGAILLMLAISYSYDTKSSQSKRITNVLWILADVFIIIGLIGQFILGKDELIGAIMFIIVNYTMWNRIKKSGDKPIE
jgi:hypothetical protein